MGGGDRPSGLGESQGVKLTGGDVGIQALGLVDDAVVTTFPVLRSLRGDFLVGGGQSLASVHHEYDGIGFFHCAQFRLGGNGRAMLSVSSVRPPVSMTT